MKTKNSVDDIAVTVTAEVDCGTFIFEISRMDPKVIADIVSAIIAEADNPDEVEDSIKAVLSLF